ncbi:MAG: S8 family peptidase [Bacteroidetes bacterium]|nr:S8 family peptidase [Bacteroidota bacterium]
MRTNFALLRMIVVLLLLISGENIYPQGKTIASKKVHSEGNFLIKDRKIYSDAIVIKFNKNVIPLTKGIQFADKSNIDPSFNNLSQTISSLEDSFGKIKIEKEVPDAVWGNIIRKNKQTGKDVEIHDFSQLFILRFSNHVPLDSVINIFKNSPDVEYVHQPIMYEYHDSPNDTYYQQGIQWNLNAVNAEGAWNITHGNSAIKIGIIDQGIMENHNDLQGKIVGGTNYYYTTEPHGTWVAGVLGAKTSNSQGIASLGWDLVLYNYGGSTSIQSNSLIAQRIVSATNAGMDIINMSFGTLRYITDRDDLLGYCPTCSGDALDKWVNAIINNTVVVPHSYQEIETAVQDAVATGIICIASTGNTSINPELPSPQLCDPMKIPFPNYPSQYQGVIGVSGTTISSGTEGFKLAWNYGNFVDVSAPGENIYTTDTSNVYNYRSGTSFSAPLTSALAGLILSINSALTNTQIESIIKNTTDKITAPAPHPYDVNGWSEALGYGRINAYKALLLAHAYNNKAIAPTATLTNSQRKLVQDGSGNFHLVFSSGGEIFYRKSVSGTTWQDPIKISYVNGSNDYPCIALGYSNYIMVVWQRLTGTNTYDVYFSMSTDGGSTWSSANRYTLETSLSSSGPQPVIARNSNISLTTVSYVSSSGLKAKRTYSNLPPNLSYWTSQQITTSSEDTPSLSNCGTSSYNVIAYANSDGHIHYRYQNSDGSWSTYNRLSTMIPGASINRMPSISGMSSDGSVHLAWVRYDNSSGYPTSPRIYYTKNSSANGSWPYQYWSILTEDEYNPSLAALASNKIDLLFTNGYNYLKYSRFNGSSWSSPVAKSTSASYPSVSSGSSTAKYVYTYGTLSPFTVTLSSETLSKANEVESTYTRSVAILDSSGAYVELQLHNMYYKKNDGSKQKIDFSSVTLDSTNVITPSNCWSFLSSTSDNLIPADAEDIVLNYTINTENADKLFENSSSPIEIEFQLQGDNKQSTKQLKQFTLANNKLSEKNEETILLSELSVVKGKDKGFISLGIKGLNPKKGTFASLGHLFDFASSGSIPKEQETSTIIPTQYELQNYPNPFNPTTRISFSLPQKSQIKLKVFDVLGREIQILADGIYEAGKYEVEFNATNLPSGVYFYNLTTQNNSITKKMLLMK